MTNKEAARILRRHMEQANPRQGELVEALETAIAALKIDFKSAGAKGGQIRTKKYSPRDFSKWGKMGGRPPKKKEP